MTLVSMRQTGTPPWTESAIRDTIATITKGADYQRALTESLWDRFTRWIWERVMDLLSSVNGSNLTRTITIFTIVLLIVLIAARIAIGISAERALRRGGPASRASIGGATQLADADALAAKGDFTAAAHALYAGVLAALAARGAIRLHASKTTGDYGRELRKNTSPSLPSFQSFRSRYDRVIYGDMRCSESDYRMLERDARAMIVREPSRERAA